MGSPDFFGRLGQIGGALLDHGSAWGDFIGDVARSPVDIYQDGFTDTLLKIIQDDVIGGLMMTAIGPEGVGGEIIEGLPGVIKEPVSAAVGVLGEVDAWQDKWIERPLAFMAMTPLGRMSLGLPNAFLGGSFDSLATGLTGFFDYRAYKTAWDIADGNYNGEIELYNSPLSLGRAVALSTLNVDLLDPRAVEEAQQSSAFNLISGAVDFGETIFLDPLLIPGKYLQLARAGKFVASIGTDLPQALRRTGNITGRSANLSPERSLLDWQRREGKLGWTNKLDQIDPEAIADFTSSRALEVVNSDNWTKLNAAIEALPGSERLRQATKGTTEFDDAIAQRATEIREFVGRKKINEDVALAFSQATNETMRTNHYLYMMGNKQAIEAAQGSATAMAQGLGKVIDSDEIPLLDKIDDVETEIETLRGELRKEIKAEDVVSENVRGLQGEQLKALLDERDELLRQVRQATEPAENWDFGFVFDIKTRFNARQVDDYAMRPNGDRGDAVARFLGANDQESLDLMDAAFDRYLADTLDTSRLDASQVLFRGLGNTADDVKDLMRIPTELDRQVYSPLAARAVNHPAGFAMKSFSTAAKGVSGRRTFTVIRDMVGQRYVDFDDSSRASNQVERVIRDFSRMEIRGQKLLDPEQAAVLESRYAQLIDPDSRRAFFEDMVGDFNMKLANALDDGGGSVDEIYEALQARVVGAEEMLQTAKNAGKGKTGAYGDRGLSSQLRFLDDEDNLVEIIVPLSPRQLANSKIVPRYDLIRVALRKEGVDAGYGFLKKSVFGRGVRAVGNAPSVQGVKGFSGDVLNGVMQAWRPAVLLRPAWPMRVVGDEILRVGSVVGALGQFGGLRHGFSDYRVELMKRKGIDVEGDIVNAMKDELFPDAWDAEKEIWDVDLLKEQMGVEDVDDFAVYQRYVEDMGEEGAVDLVDKLIREEWGTAKKQRGLAYRAMLGYATLGPVGAVGGYVLGMASQGRTVRRLAERNLATRFASDLRRQAKALVEEAKTANPEKAAQLQRAADLLESQTQSLERVLSTHYNDVPITPEEQIALETMNRAGVKLEQAGRNPTMMGGVLVRNAFGDTKANQEIFRRRVSADRSTARLIEQGSTRARRDIDENVVSYQTYTVKEAGGNKAYGKVWDETINRQWRPTGDATLPSNEYLKLVWNNNTDTYVDDLRNFLQTRRGNQVLDELGVPDSVEGIEEFISVVREQTDNMLPRTLNDGTPIDEFVGLRERLANGEEISWENVRNVLKGSDRGDQIRLDRDIEQIYGPAAALTPGGKLAGVNEKIFQSTQKAFDTLATLPTDNLTRNPLFRHHYQTEVARRLATYWDEAAGEYVINPNALGKIEAAARVKALDEVRYMLYDLTESTRLQEMVGLLAPFFGAWQEVISRWAGITAENPMYVARVLDRFHSIPVTTDDEGNEYMVFKMPEIVGAIANVGDLPGAGALTKPLVGQEMHFSKDGMSMMAAGGPGVGPVAMIPLTEVVISEPELYDALDQFFPFGIAQGTDPASRAIPQLFPTWMRRFTDAATGGPESQRLQLAVARDKEVRLRQQPALNADFPNRFVELLATDRATLEGEIVAESKSLLLARALASTSLPTSLRVASPYQSHIDQLRALREVDPSNANEKFIAEHGAEFWALTNRLTKSNNGVAPTLESMEAFEDAGLKKLVQQYPELGSLITGAMGSATTGKFHEAVYRKQQSTPVSPGSQTKMRERVPLGEFIESTDVAQFWAELGEVYDIRDAELRRRESLGGSIKIYHNPDLQEWTQTRLVEIAGAHPAGWQAYNQRDKLKDVKIFEGLQAITQNPTLLQRPEIEVLVDYLADRKQAVEELKDRKDRGQPGSLSAKANADVAFWWENRRINFRGIAEFSAIFDRLLEFDDLDIKTWDIALSEAA
jgi:hypothetical protein